MERGWRLLRPWVWAFDTLGLVLDLGALSAGLAQHTLRHAWRAWCLQEFVHGTRRDVAVGNEALRLLPDLDLDKTRKWAGTCAEARTVAGCVLVACVLGQQVGWRES